MPDDPLVLFEQWQQDASAAGLADPTGVVVATVQPDGSIRQRFVLLKGVSEDGFVFFTNYNSDKAAALAQNDRSSMLFPWNELDRQVSVSGKVEKIAESESDAYFAARPRASQIAAWTSQQSQPIASRGALEAQYQATLERFDGSDVPRPPHWGGFRLFLSGSSFGRVERTDCMTALFTSTPMVGIARAYNPRSGRAVNKALDVMRYRRSSNTCRRMISSPMARRESENALENQAPAVEWPGDALLVPHAIQTVPTGLSSDPPRGLQCLIRQYRYPHHSFLMRRPAWQAQPAHSLRHIGPMTPRERPARCVWLCWSR